MTKLISLITTALLATALNATAQPAAVKNAARSVFRLTTFDADGKELMTSHGVFVGNSGEAVSDLKPFLGAVRAVVTDSKGSQMAVSRILGANDIYDVARFSVEGKTTPLPVAGGATQGSKVWLVGFGDKNATVTAATVKGVERFMDKYSYYILSLTPPDGTRSCPFINEQGQVIGLMQPSQTSFDTHATDVRYIADLQVSGMSVNDANMRKIGIPTALPADKTQALLALMMAEQGSDSLKRAAAASDFIAQYPTAVDGYASRAQMLVDANDFDGAAKDMETAIKKAEPKDEAHFRYSKLIYYKEVYKPQPAYKPWSLDKALEEAQQANSLNPQPFYEHLQAQILFSKGEYQTAYDTFTRLLDTPIRNGELFYEASRCKLMMQSPTEEIVALLDSAIANTDTLQFHTAAPYFYARAEAYEQLGKYRDAVFDYTRYELLMNRRVDAGFYYIREQAEVKAKLFKQALNDITIAIIANPNEPVYVAEKASLELKVNMIDEAIKTATLCTKRWEDYADGFLLLGLAQVHQGSKAEGIANLEKARSLGSSQAQALIDKYGK